MPQIFRIGPYLVYFWANENDPLEPVHVHISEGRATENATKVWITSTGKCLLCHNKSKIPDKVLNRLLRAIEANHDVIITKWIDLFEEIRYYI